MSNFSKILIKNCCIFFFFRIVKDAYKRPLEAKDLIELSADLKAESTVPVFQKAWRDDLNRQKR